MTARERHIAELASAGYSSRDIAAMLGISPRTVDNHLQRVYDKLHVRSRRELGGGLESLLRSTGRATR
ncbi:helix-turn-helix domain-containing protein [Rhodococcus sp. (in: high G+C Gram-positive bacteria)]|uniref:helix-turn-helix domain-containing protein n=1 Tax=Rhodococcus sp. TaxID=1831 RepID=UPI003BB59D2A